ncbi:MAG TPA: glycosyltransferase [Anaerolineales bacterium]|nr:glycosyltransferase [Anaerolineales bacterium]HLB50037.1 glycosyltransferase [Anaerolineales bacterium]
MNLLFLTPQLPHPPRQGTAIRNWGLIKSLSARHHIALLTFAAEGEPITPELRAACQQIETVPLPRRTIADRLRDLLFSPLPDLAHRLASPQFAARLATLLNSSHFDALFFEGLELAPYISPTPHAPRSTIVFDAHNCETILQRRALETDRRLPRRWPAALYSLIQSGRLARFEAEVCRRADHVTCVSAEDAAALRALVPTLNPIIVPNGIFLSDYQSPSASRRGDRGEGDMRLVFTGKMDYRPNVDAVTWFANDILPPIQHELPNVQFVIVGQKPTEAITKLGERKGVQVTGAVDDARPYIASAAVYVAPLRMGGGTRFKLLEAMALRRPIVSTTLGAEGFAVQSGRELTLADSAADFAQAVLTLLRDESKQRALSNAGYEFVQQYDWERIVPKVEKTIVGDEH